MNNGNNGKMLWITGMAINSVCAGLFLWLIFFSDFDFLTIVWIIFGILSARNLVQMVRERKEWFDGRNSTAKTT